MASKFDLIENITPFKETWKIKVRISSLWNTPKFNSLGEVNSIDMILLDEKSGIIQGTVKKALLNKYKSQLHEGKSYIVTNFAVGENSGNYKATHHDYRVNFLHSTSVRECDDSLLPLHGFNFIPFDDIISRRTDDTYLVDVIREVTAFGNIQESNIAGQNTKRITIELQDEEKRKMVCTLWGHYADEVSTYIGGEVQTPFVMILHLARIKMWQGASTLTNSFFTTKILCDQTMPQVVDFKNRLSLGEECQSQTITQIKSQGSYSIEEDLLQKCERKNLDEFRDIRQVGVCVTLATIVKIETEWNWFYNSCKNCRKKVKPDGGRFWCENCCEYARIVVPRYKIQVRVIDHTDAASFVIFDREAMQVLHKSAATLREQLIRDKDEDSFPKDLDVLLKKKFLFKIQISDYNLRQIKPIFTVARMSCDTNIIDAYSETSNYNQDVGEGMEFDNPVVGLGSTPYLGKETVSISCCSSSITPMKRTEAHVIEELNSNEDISLGELSSTKNKQIKIENN